MVRNFWTNENDNDIDDLMCSTNWKYTKKLQGTNSGYTGPQEYKNLSYSYNPQPLFPQEFNNSGDNNNIKQKKPKKKKKRKNNNIGKTSKIPGELFKKILNSNSINSNEKVVLNENKNKSPIENLKQCFINAPCNLILYILIVIIILLVFMIHIQNSTIKNLIPVSINLPNVPVNIPKVLNIPNIPNIPKGLNIPNIPLSQSLNNLKNNNIFPTSF